MLSKNETVDTEGKGEAQVLTPVGPHDNGAEEDVKLFNKNF